MGLLFLERALFDILLGWFFEWHVLLATDAVSHTNCLTPTSNIYWTGGPLNSGLDIKVDRLHLKLQVSTSFCFPWTPSQFSFVLLLASSPGKLVTTANFLFLLWNCTSGKWRCHKHAKIFLSKRH